MLRLREYLHWVIPKVTDGKSSLVSSPNIKNIQAASSCTLYGFSKHCGLMKNTLILTNLKPRASRPVPTEDGIEENRAGHTRKNFSMSLAFALLLYHKLSHPQSSLTMHIPRIKSPNTSNRTSNPR
jgi:hypothetical protein